MLWVCDGTEAGTRPLTSVLGSATLIAPTPHGAIFPGLEPDYDSELFRTDGTPEGTAKLLELNPVPYGSDPDLAVRVGDRVVFRGQEDQSLWSTDGTADGTVKLRERALVGGIGSDGATAYFGAGDGRLWRTDGTVAGTRSVFDGGFSASTFLPVGAVGSAFVFAADWDLWRTDGTAAGTTLMREDVSWARPGAIGRRTMLVSVDDHELLRTDGTTLGATGLGRVPTPHDAAAVDDGFLAAGFDDEHGVELWHVDEDGRNARLVDDIVPGRLGSGPQWFARVRGGVLFLDRSSSPPVWRRASLDGTAVKPTALDGAPAGPATVIGDLAYVTTIADDGYRLYRTDGTDAGTTLLRELPLNFEPPTGFTAFAGTVWFTAGDDEHGVELWRTDAGGTRLARDIAPGAWSSVPLDLVATDDFLFFTAYSPEHGAEPWRIRRAPAPPGDVDEPPPVTVAPLTPAPPTAPSPPASQGHPLTVKLTVKVKRLRMRDGRTRWRVTGVLQGANCTGTVRVVLGRRDRVVKQTTVRLRHCRFDAIVATTSKARGRWLQARAGAVASRRVAVR